MPRSGGVYSLPAGSIVTDGSVAQASQHNTPLNDIAADLNAARPIASGGTGATTASGARTNLGLGTAAQSNTDAFQPADPTLTALAAFNSNGLLAQTAGDTFAARAIAGTSDQIAVTNGDGVSGNPTIALSFAAQATVEAGTNTVSPVNSLGVAQAIAANRPAVAGTTKTDTFSTTSTSYTAITGLTAAITPKTTASRVKVTVTLNVGSSENQPWLIQLTRNGSAIVIGDAASSRSRVTAEIRVDESGTFASNEMATVSLAFLDSPASDLLQTYGVRVAGVNRSGAPGTFYLNRSHVDTNASDYSRAASSIIVEEVL